MDLLLDSVHTKFHNVISDKENKLLMLNVSTVVSKSKYNNRVIENKNLDDNFLNLV